MYGNAQKPDLQGGAAWFLGTKYYSEQFAIYQAPGYQRVWWYATKCAKPSCCLVSPKCRSAGPARYEPVRSFFPVSSPNSHALANFQSRFAVSGEIPRTSAVSSILKPPK